MLDQRDLTERQTSCAKIMLHQWSLGVLIYNSKYISRFSHHRNQSTNRLRRLFVPAPLLNDFHSVFILFFRFCRTCLVTTLFFIACRSFYSSYFSKIFNHRVWQNVDDNLCSLPIAHCLLSERSETYTYSAFIAIEHRAFI